MTRNSWTTGAALKNCSVVLVGLFGMAVSPVTAQVQTDFPHAQVSWAGGTGLAELHVNGDVAALTLRTPDGRVTQLRSIETVDDALAILADERLAFAWTALLAWAGDDLHILRDKALSRAERAADRKAKPLPATGRAKIANWPMHFLAFKQYISALEHSGRSTEAIAEIRSEITAPTLGADPIVRSQLPIMLALVLFDDGQTDQAINVLQQASVDSPSKAARLNIDVNLAAILARNGQYDRALKIDNATEHNFEKSASGVLVGHRKLPDSNAYFAAVRACALNGLGRQEEARLALATIERKPAVTSDLSATNESRLFAFSCMHDASGLANELAAQIQTAPLAAQILLYFQPSSEAISEERETLAAAISMDVTIKAMAGRVRVLGGSLSSATNWWRN